MPPKNQKSVAGKYNTRSNKKDKLKKNKGDSDSDSDLDIISEDESDDEDESDEEDSDDEDDESYVPDKKKKGKKTVIKNDEDNDDEEEWTDDDGEEIADEYNREEFQKFLSRAFPSKYIQSKVDETDKKTSAKSSKKSKSQKKSGKRSKRKVVEEEEEDEEDEEEEEEEEEDDEDERARSGKVMDIVFFGGPGEYVDPDEYNEDDDNADCDSDDERAFMKENYESIEMPAKETKNDKPSKKPKKRPSNDEASEDITDVEQEYLDLAEMKKTLTQQLHKRPNSKILIHAIADCDRSVKKLVKKARIRNAKAYHKLIHDDQQNTNEIDYFKKKLSNKEQLRIMNDLREINSHMNIDKPYRLALLQSRIPPKFKAYALQKLNALRHLEPGDNEYYKIKNWVDTFMRIPFSNYKNL
jgi:hypothetical protein